MTLTLYGSGRSRWVRPLWMLRELGEPFTEVVVDRAAGGLDTPEFRRISPRGKIPVLVDGEHAITESGAIVVYLGDKFAERGLIPSAGTIERARHDAWFFFVHTELEPPVWQLHKQVRKGIGGPEVAELALRETRAALDVLERHLTGRDDVGSRFCAVDVVLASLLTWGVLQAPLEGYPALRRYRDRATARPAFPSHLYEDG